MDIAILWAYIILAALSKRSLLGFCAIPSLFAISLPESYYTQGVIPITFSFFSIVTSAIFMLMIRFKEKAVAYALIPLILYDIIFAVDSVVNKDYATWIYNNHENIVVGLHLIVMLSFDRRIYSWLGSAIRDIRSSHNFSWRLGPGESNKKSRRNTKEA